MAESLESTNVRDRRGRPDAEQGGVRGGGAEAPARAARGAARSAEGRRAGGAALRRRRRRRQGRNREAARASGSTPAVSTPTPSASRPTRSASGRAGGATGCSLPPRGRIGIFFGSWYSEPLVARAFGRLSRARYDRLLSDIAFFEQMIAEDGALVVKLWIHLSKKGLRRRLRRLEGDPATSWKVTPRRLEALPEVRPLHRGLRARDPAYRHEPRAVGPRRGDRRAVPRPDGRAHAPRALPFPARVRGARAESAARRRAARRRRRRSRSRPP